MHVFGRVNLFDFFKTLQHMIFQINFFEFPQIVDGEDIFRDQVDGVKLSLSSVCLGFHHQDTFDGGNFDYLADVHQ